jgi:putative tryptophan/tyrosine transport system substrate-binding protein
MRFSHLRRRDFITLLGGTAAVWPLGARAQQPERMRRVGVLMSTGNPEGDPESRARSAALRQGLEKLGWTEGQNIQLDYRWARGDPDQVQMLAKELVRLQPDVIVANTTTACIALKRETTTIPVVFVNVVDPIGSGLVASLARPGGNFTGLIHFEPSMAGKWLEMLKEIAPSVVRVAILYSPETLPSYALYVRVVEAAAPSFAITPVTTPANNAAEIERAIDAFAREPNGGLIVLPDATPVVNRGLIVALAARDHLPAVYPFGFFARDGGLMSYGVDADDRFRESASYIDHILKGAKPAELPVQLPTKFEMVVNIKTAKALGLDVPMHLQQRADEVIE